MPVVKKSILKGPRINDQEQYYQTQNNSVTISLIFLFKVILTLSLAYFGTKNYYKNVEFLMQEEEQWKTCVSNFSLSVCNLQNLNEKRKDQQNCETLYKCIAKGKPILNIQNIIKQTSWQMFIYVCCPFLVLAMTKALLSGRTPRDKML